MRRIRVTTTVLGEFAEPDWTEQLSLHDQQSNQYPGRQGHPSHPSHDQGYQAQQGYQQQGYPAQQPPNGGQEGYQAPPRPAKTSGLAVAGLVTAFILPGIGFILSLIAIFMTGPGKAKGRGLAIAGVAVSIISGIVVSVILYPLWSRDEGCVAAREAIGSQQSIDATGYEALARDLRSAATKAEHDDVRNAITAVADDAEKLGTESELRTPGDEDRWRDDSIALLEICSRY